MSVQRARQAPHRACRRPCRRPRVEYALYDPGRHPDDDTRYRLVTTLLDPGAAPAAELAALYAERWEIEGALDELKTHQRGPRVLLRSRTIEGVYQEAWGLCCVHYALRALLAAAADDDHLDPDRLSFIRALHAARCSVAHVLELAGYRRVPVRGPAPVHSHETDYGSHAEQDQAIDAYLRRHNRNSRPAKPWCIKAEVHHSPPNVAA